MAAWKEAETLKLSGAQTGEGPLTAGSTATTISVAGITTLTYFAVDNAGNQETPKTLTVRIDKTPPIMSCSVNPAQLWPPDHKLAPVSVTVGVTDSLSGPAGFTLRSVTSSEPGTAPGSGNTTGDIQGFVTDGEHRRSAARGAVGHRQRSRLHPDLPGDGRGG